MYPMQEFAAPAGVEMSQYQYFPYRPRADQQVGVGRGTGQMDGGGVNERLAG